MVLAAEMSKRVGNNAELYASCIIVRPHSQLAAGNGNVFSRSLAYSGRSKGAFRCGHASEGNYPGIGGTILGFRPFARVEENREVLSLDGRGQQKNGKGHGISHDRNHIASSVI